MSNINYDDVQESWREENGFAFVTKEMLYHHAWCGFE